MTNNNFGPSRFNSQVHAQRGPRGGMGGPFSPRDGFAPNWGGQRGELGKPRPHSPEGFQQETPFSLFGERKAPRGSISAALMDLLLDGPESGYSLMKLFSERTGGKWAPQSGTIYPALGKLVTQQLLSVTADESPLYSLTDSGRERAESSHNSMKQLFEQMSTETPEGDLFRAGRDLMKAMWAIFTQGTMEQHAVVTNKLVELRKEIYRMLSE